MKSSRRQLLMALSIATAATLADWLEGDGKNVGLADVAHTLNHHRAVHARFATVCARRSEEAGGFEVLHVVVLKATRLRSVGLPLQPPHHLRERVGIRHLATPFRASRSRPR